MQKFIKELKKTLPIIPQFMLWGNIYDIYPYEKNGIIQPLKLNIYLSKILKAAEYDVVLYFEPLYGLSVLEGKEEDFKHLPNLKYSKEPQEMSLVDFIKLYEDIDKNNEVSVATIFNFSSRVTEACCSKITNEFFYRAFRLMHTTIPKKTKNASYVKYNPLIFLFDKDNDIPAWYTKDNPKIKSIPIPKPDIHTRTVIIKYLSKRIKGYSELSENEKTKYENFFIDQTSGLYMHEILSIISLAIKDNIPYNRISEAINMYKLGVIENEWSKISIDKLKNSEQIISKRVIGQPYAVNKAADILKRAYFNLSGSQFSKHSNRPKGVMFFAGPTGVGKTELAKTITELVFGSEDNYIRFDMSEFAQEHSNQRLIGAPPGYVGYETGGELTNAIKENPFSVILFDEIEKAHPKIMDIFLQILDDGRLTSSKGETVYFSEAIIIFTSNLGMYEIDKNNNKIQNVTIDMDYETIKVKLLSSINDYFKYNLKRPEILNRIGENVVVFDFIRKDTAILIFEKMLNNIFENLFEKHKITVKLTQTALEKLKQETISDLTMGGRGIGNKLEELFINPLSNTLFNLNAKENDTINVTDIIQEDARWKLIANIST